MAHELVVRGGTIVDGTGADPFVGDVGIDGGTITAVGGSLAGARVIDADGALVAPGWVDVHTHFDGQVTWDDELDPSFSNGVTTLVMGNCGVGFAPCPPGAEATLIELMEGVEDIPGTALSEGVPWGAWSTFPEYLDFLAGRRYSLDIGAQLAHGALRFAVMGERGVRNEDATAADLAEMRRLAREAAAAGALGFSTSRTVFHRSATGEVVPGTFASADELGEIVAGMMDGGGGVFEAITSSSAGSMRSLGGERFTQEQELAMLADISVRTGAPITFTTLQVRDPRDGWREALAFASAVNGSGARLYPQVASRPTGIIASLDGYHPFMRRPSYLALADLPLADRARALRDPAVRAGILAETDVAPATPGSMDNVPRGLAAAAGKMYPLDEVPNYEPGPDRTFAAIGAAQGVTAIEALYDHLTAGEGTNLANDWGSGYIDGNLDALREMLLDPNSITGLADAGAHVRFICDGTAPTTQLTHWARDRTRGERLPLAFVVEKQTRRNAQLYGLTDRGVLAPGMRADLNVIDFDRLAVRAPRAHADLPAGGWRFLQPVEGYVATVVAGVQTRAADRDTGERPGRLVRRRAS